jgi:hypothetical protein
MRPLRKRLASLWATQNGLTNLPYWAFDVNVAGLT